MTIKRTILTVLLDDPEQPDAEPTEHTVEVRLGDQMRAELEGRKIALTKITETPFHMTAMWAWAAMVRTGVYGGKWQQFAKDAIAVDDGGGEDTTDVDPSETTTPGDSS